MHRLITLLMLVLTGCATTSAILSGPKYKGVLVTGFYVNMSSGQLLVSSTETDKGGRPSVPSTEDGYVFSIDKKFGESLLLSRELLFSPKFENFKIDEEHNVTGRLILTVVEKNLSEEQLRNLEELGFNRKKPSNELKLITELSGERYTIEGDLPLEKLDKDYFLLLTEADSFVVSAGKIIAAPAMITIGTVVAIPVAFLVVGTMALGGP